MRGTVWQRCTKCLRRVNGAEWRKKHAASDCTGTKTAWQFKTDVGTDASGKRIQKVRSGFRTQAEAERAMRELQAKVDGGRHVEPSKLTLAEYLDREWLPATAPPRVSHGTWVKRKLHSTYVVPRLGGRPLAKVNGADLDRLYGELTRSGGAKGQPLAASTVRDVHRTLHKAFSDARRWQLIDRNPCESAEPPRLERVAEDARTAQRAWSVSQLRRFLTAARSHRLGPLFYLAATTGLRRGELCGLRWTDVDLDRGALRVAQVLVNGPKGYELRPGAKTAAGGRSVSLDGATVTVLRDHRRVQTEARLALGPAFMDQGLVFAREDGLPLSPPGVTQAFRRLVDGLDLPRIRLHDLRHTHATLLLQAGKTANVVGGRLGHSSPSFTVSTYGHVLPGMQEDAAATFAALLADESSEVG